MSHFSIYDWKHIRLIEKKLLMFKENKIDLFDFINSSNLILNSIEGLSVNLRNSFQSKINFLEIINDSIEDGSISRWRGDFEEDLDKTVEDLKKMISRLREDYLKIPDPKITEIATEGDSKWLICPSCSDAWESESSDAMVICPNCEYICHNPRFN